MECIKVNGIPICNTNTNNNNNNNTNNNTNTNNNNNGTCVCNCTCVCHCTCNCNGWGNNMPNGNLNIEHHGAYIARFYISWEEPMVIGNSIQMVRKDWENNGHQYTSGFSTTISIPMSAQNVNIKAEGNTGLVWQLWNTIIEKVGLPMVPLRTVKIWGTSLNQQGSVEPEGEGTSGYLYLDHYGAFVARIYIFWDEPAAINGNVYTVRKRWENNGNLLTAPYHTIIPIVMTASNFDIKAEYLTPDPYHVNWGVLVDKTGLPMVKVRTVTLRGTIFNPSGTIDPS